MAKDWMMDGAKEETEDAAIAGAVTGSVVGAVGMATGGGRGRAISAAPSVFTLWFYKIKVFVSVEDERCTPSCGFHFPFPFPFCMQAPLCSTLARLPCCN